jgi:hypothetical protein
VLAVEQGAMRVPAIGPRRPSPDAGPGGEVVAVVAEQRLGHLVGVTGDHPHRRLVAIALEQLLAVDEERGVGDAVVLDEDRLVDLREDPVDPALDVGVETPVGLRESPVDLAGPADVAEELADLRAESFVVRVARPRAVGDHEQLLWSRLPDRGQAAPGQLRTVENEHDDGGLQHHLLMCLLERGSSRPYRG